LKKITLEISDQDTDDLENAIEKFNRLMELLEDLSLSVHEIKEMLNDKNQTEPLEDSL
jgi:N-dimethylarginine dimethylaminohydrolase|tara:strand:- start:716 stop:889 length:174 start_codon:yes stop_codon:yes gene_type:complete